MKTLFNLTTAECDLERYESREDFLTSLKDFDGVELMYFGEDTRQIVPEEKIYGIHMRFFPFWLDFWNGNESALRKEFDDRGTWERCYGGSDREALLNQFRQDLHLAHRFHAAYVVFHISEASIEESFTWNYRHTDEEVIDAAAELLNELFKDEDGSLILLLENLWQPGLNMLRPEMTQRLLEKVSYPNKGIMLDTGHYLHTNTSLRTQEEGLVYLQKMLDAHGMLCQYIRGIHLNQSLTGEYCEKMRQEPPEMGKSYEERYAQMFLHAFETDKHQPFTCSGVRELVERIAPEYVTFEFITEDRAQQERYLKEQLHALGK